jgi:hypothetical protein
MPLIRHGGADSSMASHRGNLVVTVYAAAKIDANGEDLALKNDRPNRSIGKPTHCKHAAYRWTNASFAELRKQR